MIPPPPPDPCLHNDAFDVLCREIFHLMKMGFVTEEGCLSIRIELLVITIIECFH